MSGAPLSLITARGSSGTSSSTSATTSTPYSTPTTPSGLRKTETCAAPAKTQKARTASKSMKTPLFAFFGTSVDSRYALEQLERLGLPPALVIDGKDPPAGGRGFPPELYNPGGGFFFVAA